ncbi:MAG: hypothetical protein KDB22_09760 [Planctomycetales bacterium]|nr:hypothetical protein [Planctomycetales bacterium]
MIFGKFYACAAVLGCLLLVVGCAENPGKWPKDKVQAKIEEKLELTELTLNPREGGGFEGTGKLGGETVTITITQDPASGRMSWDAKGDRGLVETGFYELK